MAFVNFRVGSEPLIARITKSHSFRRAESFAFYNATRISCNTCSPLPLQNWNASAVSLESLYICMVILDLSPSKRPWVIFGGSYAFLGSRLADFRLGSEPLIIVLTPSHPLLTSSIHCILHYKNALLAKPASHKPSRSPTSALFR